jgi:hypothetical protein
LIIGRQTLFCQSPPAKSNLAAICAEQPVYAPVLDNLREYKFPAVPSLPDFIV